MAPFFESRGYFWWNHQSPKEETVPPEAVPGRIVIDENGRARLTLDGLLTDGFKSAVEQYNTGKKIVDKSILGLLYGDNSFVCLEDLQIVNSHLSFNSRSREELIASYSLRGGYPLFGPDGRAIFEGFEIDLSRIEEWTRPNDIRAKAPIEEKSTISQTFEYSRERFSYRIKGGTLSITFDIDGDCWRAYAFGVKAVSFARKVVLGYESDDPFGMTKLRLLSSHVQEFLALLMGVYIELDWPKTCAKSESKKHFGTVFYQKGRLGTRELSIQDLWTVFSVVRDSLGDLFGSFLEAREAFGPGVYLYLACLRTEAMFPENRFTTLITGLEALYRRDLELPQESTTERRRVERILTDIKQESDRKWLQRKLNTRAELSLQDKLTRLFQPLEECLDASNLAKFAATCADMRNDITHFGGLRNAITYDELLKRLAELTPALSSLYHALLLWRIGVSPEIIRSAFSSGHVSPKLKSCLKQVGLLKAETDVVADYPSSDCAPTYQAP
jgi:ApeA N-terminal domain 1